MRLCSVTPSRPSTTRFARCATTSSPARLRRTPSAGKRKASCRQIWLDAGKHGLLGFDVPEEYGGAGISDFRYNAILAEEIANTGTVGVGFTLQNDVVAPYLVKLTNDEQKARWLPGFASGEIITAIAMTEPGAGSDLQGVATTARRDGDHYVVNGSKTFITNGILSDLVVVVVKTDPSAGHKGMSLLAVERGMAGFERGRNLDKAGMKSQDTAELFFNDVRVPATNLIGEEGRGFYHLMMSLPQERLSIGVPRCRCRAGARADDGVLPGTQGIRYVDRQLPEHPLRARRDADRARVARAYIDQCILALNDGKLTDEAAGAKYWTTDLQGKVVDQCVQLHGGYGFMSEYEVSRLGATHGSSASTAVPTRS